MLSATYSEPETYSEPHWGTLESDWRPTEGGSWDADMEAEAALECDRE